jgi:hypothetical protein
MAGSDPADVEYLGIPEEWKSESHSLDSLSNVLAGGRLSCCDASHHGCEVRVWCEGGWYASPCMDVHTWTLPGDRGRKREAAEM